MKTGALTSRSAAAPAQIKPRAVQQATPNLLLDLPPELLVKVVSHLIPTPGHTPSHWVEGYPPLQALVRLGCTCAKLRAFCMWYTPHLFPDRFVPPTEAVRLNTSHTHDPARIRVSRETEAAIPGYVSRIPKLGIAFDLDEGVLRRLLDGFASRQCRDLTVLSGSGDTSLALAPTTTIPLQSLTIYPSSGSGKDVLALSFLRACRELQELRIIAIYSDGVPKNVRDCILDLLKLVHRLAIPVQQLLLEFWGSFDLGEMAACELPSVRRVNIYCCDTTFELYWPILRACINLQTLQLYDQNALDPRGAHADVDKLHWPHLTHLICSLHRLRRFVGQVMDRSPNLSHLSLNYISWALRDTFLSFVEDIGDMMRRRSHLPTKISWIVPDGIMKFGESEQGALHRFSQAFPDLTVHVYKHAYVGGKEEWRSFRTWLGGRELEVESRLWSAE